MAGFCVFERFGLDRRLGTGRKLQEGQRTQARVLAAAVGGDRTEDVCNNGLAAYTPSPPPTGFARMQGGGDDVVREQDVLVARELLLCTALFHSPRGCSY